MAKVLGKVGDVSVPEEDGGFVFDGDPPFLEWVVAPDTIDNNARWTVYRVDLDQKIPDWGDIRAVASATGASWMELGDAFMDIHPLVRAQAYMAWTDYYGWTDFDEYPLSLDSKQIDQRYGTNLTTFGSDEEEADLIVQHMTEFVAGYIETVVLEESGQVLTINRHTTGTKMLAEMDIHLLKTLFDDSIKFSRDNHQILTDLFFHAPRTYTERNAGRDFWISRNRRLGYENSGIMQKPKVAKLFATLATNSYKWPQAAGNIYRGSDKKLHLR